MKITNILYHRNGSGCCEGFTQVFFSADRKLKNMMAIAFEHTSQLAIVNLDDLTAKFDGDYYRANIVTAISVWSNSWVGDAIVYTQKFPFEVK